MPNDLQTLEASSQQANNDFEELRGFFVGRDNPFDVYVAGRNPDSDFCELHVPTLYPDIHDRIQAVIERYRLCGTCKASDIPRSGAVVIQGKRGAGKTHTLHAVRLMDLANSPAVVVCPTFFETHRPIYEYLLHQLVRHFQNDESDETSSMLDQLAGAFTRRVLVQALHAMTEVAWLGEMYRGRIQYLLFLLGFGTRDLALRKEKLIGTLYESNGSLTDACREFELEVATLKRIALGYINREEKRNSIAGQIRHGLYSELVNSAFDETDEQLYQFLLDGYTQVKTHGQPSRELLVEELLRALLELCLLAKMPVVFAFDAMEELLGDPPENKICHEFFRGIAKVIDEHRGIPFLIFAETGHWQQSIKSRSNYAAQRFQMGVLRVPGCGRVSDLSFPPVSAEQLAHVATVRLKPLRDDFEKEHGPTQAPTYYPFTNDDFAGVAGEKGSEPPLRQALQRMAELYDQRINGVVEQPVSSSQIPAAPSDDAALMTEELGLIWSQEQRKASRELTDNNRSGLADRLHNGLLNWLKIAIKEGVTIKSGKFNDAENCILTNHPTYGQITHYCWSNGTEQSDFGVGFLLGYGSGRPADLETKLKMATLKKRPFAKLIILWPQGAELSEPIHNHFTGTTLQKWEKYTKEGVTKNVIMRSLDPGSLAPWLFLTSFLKNAKEQFEDSSANVIDHFVMEQTNELFELITAEE